MSLALKTLACLIVLSSFGLGAHAQRQPAPLPVHAVHSISPADADFQDLEFLKQEIGPARVVMLGEPSHGEGNVFEAKIRLIRFLREQMGFTTVAFESGFYDLHKAQQALEAGRPASEALGSSVMPVWTATQEFQAIMPLVGPGKLRVAGFDPQLTGDYGGDLVDDLQAFLAPEKGAAALNYDYLEEVISFMGEHFAFLPTTKLVDFEQEMSKVRRILDKPAAGPDANRRAEAAFWQQCGRSLLAQARDYALNESGTKEEKDFTAVTSNPRDAEMADNLIWYLKQHPQEKVICWAALPHISNKAAVLEDAELHLYHPMGEKVKAAFGADQVYILGTLAGGGTHGFANWGGYQSVPAPAAGTLEAELLTQPADYAFVSLKHDAPGRRLTTYAFDYKEYTGVWSEVVDGFLFLRSVNPPHGASVRADVPALGTSAAAADGQIAPSVFNPAARPQRVSAGTTGQTVRGVVLDRQTGQPVPYASVASSKAGLGTVADGQGRFALKLTGTGQRLQVSSMGYATASVTAAGSSLTVKLVPAAYALQGVEVRAESLDPRKIMKKVLAALPTNYEQQDYSAEVYTHRRTSNFDTLRYEFEAVSQLFEPAGFRHWAGGFLMLGAVAQHREREIHLLRELNKSGNEYAAQFGQGFATSSADPVRISPLFKTSSQRKFNLRLDSVLEKDGNMVYVIGFAAKHANHRSTGTYLTSAYSGRLYVQQRDYAVTRYEALWETDTITMNAVGRQHLPRHDFTSKLYPNLYATDRTDHVVNYALGSSGRYHVRSSVARGLSVGRVLRTGEHFYSQKFCEQFFTPLPAGTPPLLSKASLTVGEAQAEMKRLPVPEYHPGFWQTYQRPGVEGVKK